MSGSKALAAWQELNDRQQGTLRVIYDLDQENEASRRRDAARGRYDSHRAAEWRVLDFAHDPSDRRMFGWTEMQMRLASAGWDNQGNGSTMAALADRALVTRSWKPTTFGQMPQITLTREGRAAARAGTSVTLPGRITPKLLSGRSWEVLALLWSAGLRGAGLESGFSKTIEYALMDKHVPPLAERAARGLPDCRPGPRVLPGHLRRPCRRAPRRARPAPGRLRGRAVATGG